jgi:hypothetical protein
MRVLILRNTIAGGEAREEGEEVELSKYDAEILIVRGKARAILLEPDVEPFPEEEPPIETATAEPPENAMKPPAQRRKRSKRGR